MSMQLAEELKQKLTDKFVVVSEGVPELRRFGGLTGQVKTVNMNCRALVQFDGPADIAWYDIDPAYLNVVDAPVAKKKTEGHAPKAEAPAKSPAKPPAAVKPAGGAKSPLELAREQAAAKSAPSSGEKKLSPLELARQQGAAKSTPSAAAPAVAGEKKLSPLELARMQGAKKPAPSTPAAAESPPAPPPAAAAPVASAPSSPPTPAKEAAAAPLVKPGSTAEILALIRQQGPVKR